jgi:hypothetical protein
VPAHDDAAERDIAADDAVHAHNHADDTIAAAHHAFDELHKASGKVTADEELLRDIERTQTAAATRAPH